MDPQVWHKIAAVSGNFFYQTHTPAIIFSSFVFASLQNLWDEIPISLFHSLNHWNIHTGVAALGLGTYGAHVFKPQNPSYREVSSHFPFPFSRIISFQFCFFVKEFFNELLRIINVKVWHTASLYHLVHTTALVAAPMAKNPNIVSYYRILVPLNCRGNSILVHKLTFPFPS